jgi:hypothetical protein
MKREALRQSIADSGHELLMKKFHECTHTGTIGDSKVLRTKHIDTLNVRDIANVRDPNQTSHRYCNNTPAKTRSCRYASQHTAAVSTDMCAQEEIRELRDRLDAVFTFSSSSRPTKIITLDSGLWARVQGVCLRQGLSFHVELCLRQGLIFHVELFGLLFC